VHVGVDTLIGWLGPYNVHTQSTMFTHNLLDSILHSMREGLLLEAAWSEDTPLLATVVADHTVAINWSCDKR
jgi:hypothetical protein